MREREELKALKVVKREKNKEKSMSMEKKRKKERKKERKIYVKERNMRMKE
jgi:hypothetical protein